jgi:hypothetical protein
VKVRSRKEIMKRKLYLTLVGVIVASSLTACGAKSKQTTKQETSEETEVTEDVVDDIADIDEVEVTEDVVDDAADTEEQAEPVDESYGGNESEYDEFTQALIDEYNSTDHSYQKWYDDALEGGVTCTSAYDYLNEDGGFDTDKLGDSGQVGNHDYTGRFVFPTMKDNDVVSGAELSYLSDMSECVDFIYDGVKSVATFYLGNDNYEFFTTYQEGDNYNTTHEFFCSIKTPLDSSDVYVSRYINDDENSSFGYGVYYFELGAFSVKIQLNEDTSELTADDLQKVVDSIVYYE